MKQLCLILAIMTLPIISYGQFIGDTLIVYVENRAEIKVAVSDYEDLKHSDSIQFALNRFKVLLPQFLDQLSSDKAEMVRYNVGGELTIEDGDSKMIYREDGEDLQKTGIRDQAIISGVEYKIFITVSDLSQLISLDLAGCMEKTISKLPEKTRWSKAISYECKNESIVELDNKSLKMDVLELQMGVGAGLIKNKWVTDLSFGLGLGFNYKGMRRGPNVSSNMIFGFDTENKMNINTFLNVGYSWNFNKESEKANFLGFDIGYLIVKNGEMFGENTFKIGATWSPAKNINVSPQLYITDNFKRVFPGIRIGFGF